MTSTTTVAPTMWVDHEPGIPSTLIGHPTHVVSDMHTSTLVSGSADNVLVLGDVSQYYVVDRLGMTMAFVPVVLGNSQRPVGQSGWFSYWRVGGDCMTSSAFRTLVL
jgi:HK97 family phage major capsid protein